MSEKFKEYSQLQLVKVADHIREIWKHEKTFEKSIETRKSQANFVFYEGPPSANGMPGIHHVMSRAIKDLFCRFHTMKGKRVLRKGGWDTHGLPVELGVEKELGITKEDIGTKISVKEYNDACRKAVMKYTHVWEKLTLEMGYWVDMKNPYITYKPKYMETLWWLLKELYKKNLLYKGYSIQPYSPAAGTGLSSHELNMPGAFRIIKDTTIIAQFKVLKESLPNTVPSLDADLFFLAWTTTPWTLPSNTALTIGKNIDYVIIETFNRYTEKKIYVVLAKALIDKIFKSPFIKSSNVEEFSSIKIPYRVVFSCQGKEFLGSKYEQLLQWALPYENLKNAFKVIHGDFVTTQDGTGIVHTAATFGTDDFLVSKKNNIPPLLVLDKNKQAVPLVDRQGKFIESLPKPFGGAYVKNEYYSSKEKPKRSVDVEIAIHLKESNRAFRVEKYEHSYPHCWRTDKPILYYPLNSWFIKTSQLKEGLVEKNREIKWKPKSTGIKRFENWLKNINDWNLSRSRFWGTPLPIWKTNDEKEIKFIGSVEELVIEIRKSIEVGFLKKHPYSDFNTSDFSDENYNNIDLHKHAIDDIVLVSDSGKPMYRESDLIDVWFDSGAMPYAQWHYPFSKESRKMIDNKYMFPADFICEGVDQTRGWFYTLHAIAGILFNSKAFKNVVSNGLVLDKNGQKMSKRLRNSVDPFETIKKYGPDATRWYLISNSQPWDNLKFNIEGIDEVRRKFFGTLYNTYSFFALYANLDCFRNNEPQIPVDQRCEIDRWIISKLNSLIKFANNHYENYEPTQVARAIQSFVLDDLSNWYVRLNRRRFWKSENSEDKLSAYQTLYQCLLDIAKISAPIAPFFMDSLYRDLTQPTELFDKKSVHLTLFPNYRDNLINEKLEEKTRITQLLTSLALGIRKKEKIKVRQPLKKLIIPILDKSKRLMLQSVIPLLCQEINVKEVQLLSGEEIEDILIKTVKPNFKNLGPKLGSKMKFFTKVINQLSQEEIQILEQNNEYTLDAEGHTHILKLEDVIIQTKDVEGWKVISQNGWTVALDIQITAELESEGFARELINRIQNIRKDIKLNVSDKIEIKIQGNSFVKHTIEQNKNYICNEIMAIDIKFDETIKNGIEIEINDKKIVLKIIKTRS